MSCWEFDPSPSLGTMLLGLAHWEAVNKAPGHASEDASGEQKVKHEALCVWERRQIA